MLGVACCDIAAHNSCCAVIALTTPHNSDTLWVAISVCSYRCLITAFAFMESDSIIRVICVGVLNDETRSICQFLFNAAFIHFKYAA